MAMIRFLPEIQNINQSKNTTMKYRPGQKVPASGIYAELTMYGSKLTEITCVKGEPFPPTKGIGYHYELVRAAVHRRSEG